MSKHGVDRDYATGLHEDSNVTGPQATTHRCQIWSRCPGYSSVNLRTGLQEICLQECRDNQCCPPSSAQQDSRQASLQGLAELPRMSGVSSTCPKLHHSREPWKRTPAEVLFQVDTWLTELTNCRTGLERWLSNARFGFGSQHIHGCSHTLTPVPGNPVPFDLHRHHIQMVYSCMQANTHI